jgi:hypothetical protein
MTRTPLLLPFALALLVVVAALTYSDAAQAPPLPKPGPEHDVLKADVGTWDATVEVTMDPSAPPMTSKGIEVNTLSCGGLCLITEFKGEMMGGAFLGHGIMTWDPARKKYVGSWTDSMSGGLAATEGTFDPVSKRFTGTMEGPDASGNITKSRSVVEYKDGGRVMSAYVPGPDGKEMQVLKITYTRRK